MGGVEKEASLVKFLANPVTITRTMLLIGSLWQMAKIPHINVELRPMVLP